MSVGHAATCPFAYEMFGNEERTTMTHVDTQTVQCHLGRYLIAVVTDAPGNIRPERSHITHSVKLSWPALSGRLLGPARNGQSEGVHIVHTLGFGSGRTGAGLGRIPYVWAGVPCLQGLEPGSSPTSGTVFPQVRGFLVLFSCGQCPPSRP